MYLFIFKKCNIAEMQKRFLGFPSKIFCNKAFSFEYLYSLLGTCTLLKEEPDIFFLGSSIFSFSLRFLGQFSDGK